MKNSEPSNMPRWGLAAALAWVGSRSLDTVERCAGKRLEEVDFWLIKFHQDAAWRKVFSEDADWQDFEKSHWNSGLLGPADPWRFTDDLLRTPPNDKEALLGVLRNGGMLQSWGVIAHGDAAGKTTAIPCVEWDTLRLGDIDAACNGAGVIQYRSVRVDKSDLLKAFPERKLPSKAGAKRKAGRPVEYPWQSFTDECERVWQEQGGFMEDDPEFSRPAHLIRIMGQWCEDHPKIWKGGPGETMLKSKVGEFLAGKGH